MKWHRSINVACRCGHTATYGVDTDLLRDEQALVRKAMWCAGWLRVVGLWVCPTCAARLVTCQQGLTTQTQRAVEERAEAVRIAVVVRC